MIDPRDVCVMCGQNEAQANKLYCIKCELTVPKELLLIADKVAEKSAKKHTRKFYLILCIILVVGIGVGSGLLSRSAMRRHPAHEYTPVELDQRANEILTPPKIESSKKTPETDRPPKATESILRTLPTLASRAPIDGGESISTPNDRGKTREYILYDIPLDIDLQIYAIKACEKRSLDPQLLFSVMKVESNFKADLISKTDDYGLMQINKCNHGWLKDKLGITDFLNPQQSIDCGVYMLANLFDKYENPHKALTAYNWGEGGMKKGWKKGIKSSAYSRKVIKTMEGVTKK